ncbi:MAG: sulfotransferase domain-containing protein, partial [Thermodesulfovibrionales bacterium]|nr:sulfotransferase domain-containing protein [Thermodesulfovibrionales bacterium]
MSITPPNFLCVGAQKAATTTIFEVLKQHPDVYIHPAKEIHFFDSDDIYNRGMQWYLETYFKNINHKKAIGEMTPSYMFIENVPERIYKCIGNKVKLIFTYRNPADRAYSHYLMNVMRGLETEPF